MELVTYNLKNKKIKILTGGKTSYNENGEKLGFKATTPIIINIIS